MNTSPLHQPNSSLPNSADIRIWEFATGQQLFAFKEHTSHVAYAEFSPDGKRVASASDDGTARVWEAATGKEIVVFRDHFGSNHVSRSRFSKDGNRVVSSAHEDGRAIIWNAQTGAVGP
jgi:WD40 repeat protein